tara:strand:+ start:149 stop:355 length:207 start_codon:yes stop_codon:yes gene_type:complete
MLDLTLISFKKWIFFLTVGLFTSVSYSNPSKAFPENMPLHTKILWGENGVLRKIKLAPEPGKKSYNLE